MYKVTKRDCPMFGIGPYVCEFICDTASDISTLPTSISEGTGGRTAYDNQKCASGSIANVAENGAESKQYMLNNQDIWCPYSVASGSSESTLEEAKAYTDSEIADLINGAPTTRDTLKEIADAMAENQTVVEALDAAIGSKANKTDIPTKVSELENDSGYLTEHQDLSAYAKTTDIPTVLPANGGTADTARQVVSSSSKVRLWEDNEGGNLELVAPDGVHLMQMDLYNNEGFRIYFYDGSTIYFPVDFNFSTGKFNINGNADTVDGLHANEIATNPNLLINPDFKINQRGKTDFSVSYHTGSPIPQSQVYTVDRWRIMDGRANISNGKFTLTGTIIQALENSIGGDFTASVSVESGTATASYDDSTKTFSIVGNNAVLNWAKLEYGSVATPFISPDPILELIKCQRFFYRKRNITGYFGCGYCENPRDAYTTFPLFMRIAPTVKHNGLMIFTKDQTVAHDTTSTSYSITGATGHLCNFGVRIDFTVDFSSKQMSAGCAAMLIATTPGEHGGYFELDAEIY